jgi:hypothetical protein
MKKFIMTLKINKIAKAIEKMKTIIFERFDSVLNTFAYY